MRGLFVLAVAVTVQMATARAEPAVAKLPPVGTVSRAGEAEGLEVKIKVQGPAAEMTPLQIACVFEYVAGDLTTPPALPAAANGMVHVDEALKGLVTDLRKSGRFSGHALETLLVTPPKGMIAGDRLLLIGLGDRKAFTPALLARVGAVGMREALRLGVTAYAHASDIKDAGVDSPTGATASAVIGGALDALAAQRWLADKGMSPRPSVTSLTLLAGPAFFAETTAAARDLLARRARR